MTMMQGVQGRKHVAINSATVVPQGVPRAHPTSPKSRCVHAHVHALRHGRAQCATVRGQHTLPQSPTTQAPAPCPLISLMLPT